MENKSTLIKQVQNLVGNYIMATSLNSKKVVNMIFLQGRNFGVRLCGEGGGGGELVLPELKGVVIVVPDGRLFQSLINIIPKFLASGEGKENDLRKSNFYYKLSK